MARPPLTGLSSGMPLCGRVTGRGGMTVRWRSAQALLMAAFVSVGRNGSPTSAGGTVLRGVGTIGEMPGGGGGGADTGRLVGGVLTGRLGRPVDAAGAAGGGVTGRGANVGGITGSGATGGVVIGRGCAGAPAV